MSYLPSEACNEDQTSNFAEVFGTGPRAVIYDQPNADRIGVLLGLNLIGEIGVFVHAEQALAFPVRNELAILLLVLEDGGPDPDGYGTHLTALQPLLAFCTTVPEEERSRVAKKLLRSDFNTQGILDAVDSILATYILTQMKPVGGVH